MLTWFLSIFVFLSNVYAQTLPQAPKRERVQAIGTLDYFTTTANYSSSGGSFKDLPNGGSYKNILARFGGSYDLDNKWHLLGTLAVANANSEDSAATRSSTDLSDLSFEAQYWLMRRPVTVIPVAKYTYPLQRVSSSTDSIISSEGAMTLEVGSWVAKQFVGPVRGLAYLGLKYQDEGRATLLPWTLAAEYKPEQWFLSGGLRGFETFSESSDSRTDHETVTNRVNGGSLKYYAVNPSSKELFAEAGLHNKDWSCWFGLAQTFNGEEYAAGLTATVGAIFNLDILGGSRGGRETYMDDLENGKSSDKFDYGGEEYDENLFKSSSPVRTQDEYAPIEKPKVKKKRVKKRPKGPSTDKMLDDVEKKLEEAL